MDTVNGNSSSLWSIKRYTPADEAVWNRFAAESRNATFLFDRRYMDYHSDRFADCSLMAFKDGRLLAMLPADEVTDGAGCKLLRSHGGLSYGGWILPPRHFDCADMLALFDEWLRWSRSEGFSAIDYKPLPGIYHRMPSGEDIYALWHCGGVMTECNASATIDLSSNPGFNTLQRRHLRKAQAHGVVIRKADNPEKTARFHEMLVNCLAERHDTAPVHTHGELSLLIERFPEQIEVWLAEADGEPMAGVCLYRTGQTDHAQYIATTPEGRRLNMLTPLFATLIERASADGCRYFDFGISNEEHGRILNAGLFRHKASLGASAVPFTRWRVGLT